MTKINFNVIKLVYLTLVLIGWKLLTQDCLLFIFALASITFFLAMSFSETKLLYRRNVANAVFKKESLFFSWLQTRWFVLLISTFKALIVGIILLIAFLQWNEKIIQVMFADIAILLIIYQSTKYYLTKHTKQDVNQIISRRVSIIINVVILVPILIAVMFYSSSPEYLDVSLKQTVLNAQMVSQSVSCDIVSILLSYDAMRDGFGWWLMTKASSETSNTTFLLLGWTLFLSLHTLYVWAFSKLILSTTIPCKSLFFRFKSTLEKNGNSEESSSKNDNTVINQKWYQLDAFSLGFFGAIIILLSLTLTFSVDESVGKPLQVEHNKSKHSKSKLMEMLDSIDTFANNEKTKNIDAMNRFIEIRVNQVFQSVYKNIPAYVDRQYVWYRDYTSIYQVAKKEIGDTWKIWKYFVNKHIWKDDVQFPSLHATQSYAQKSSEEVQRVLFGNGAFEKEIDTLHYDSNRYMQSILHKSQGNLLDSIADIQVSTSYASDVVHIGEVNRAIEETFLQAKNELNKVYNTYKIGQAGVTIILTKTIMAKLLAKSGVKVLTKTGGVWVGLTVCAPSGPWAIACGAATGVLTWIGVDFAVSEVDEVLSRKGFEDKLHQEIDRNKDALKQTLKQSYRQGINQVFNDINSEIKRPIDIIRD